MVGSSIILATSLACITALKIAHLDGANSEGLLYLAGIMAAAVAGVEFAIRERN